jgi:hypothetical protein
VKLPDGTLIHPDFDFENGVPDLEEGILPERPQLLSTPVHTDIRQFLQSVSGSKTPTTPTRPYTTDRSVTPPRSPDIRQYGTSCRRLNFEDKGTKSPVLERVYPEFLNIMN